VARPLSLADNLWINSGLNLNSTTAFSPAHPLPWKFQHHCGCHGLCVTKVTVTQTYTVVIAPRPPQLRLPRCLTRFPARLIASNLLPREGKRNCAYFCTQQWRYRRVYTQLWRASLRDAHECCGGGDVYFAVTSLLARKLGSGDAHDHDSALPAITTTSLPSGNIGIVYSKQLTCTGGAGGTVSWAITSGSLPAGSGLTLNTASESSRHTNRCDTYTFSLQLPWAHRLPPRRHLRWSSQPTDHIRLHGYRELSLPFVSGLQLWVARRLILVAGCWERDAARWAEPQYATGLISGTPTTTTGSPFSGIVVQLLTASRYGTQVMTFTINAARSSASNSELKGNMRYC